MPLSSEYCLDLPADFPDAELQRYMAFARKTLLEPTKSAAWAEFAGASNLVGWRYRASYDDWQLYKSSIAAHSNPDHEELYRRERALFGMFSAGVSCIESTVYSLAALASHPTLLGIPFGQSEQRKCGPRVLRDWLAPFASAAGLSATLDRLLVSAEWELWVGLRNRMTHRSNLPRVIQAWIGSTPPPIKSIHFAATSSTPPVEADPVDFDALHNWLSKTLGALLAAGAALK